MRYGVVSENLLTGLLPHMKIGGLWHLVTLHGVGAVTRPILIGGRDLSLLLRFAEETSLHEGDIQPHYRWAATSQVVAPSTLP